MTQRLGIILATLLSAATTLIVGFGAKETNADSLSLAAALTGAGLMILLSCRKDITSSTARIDVTTWKGSLIVASVLMSVLSGALYWGGSVGLLTAVATATVHLAVTAAVVMALIPLVAATRTTASPSA